MLNVVDMIGFGSQQNKVADEPDAELTQENMGVLLTKKLANEVIGEKGNFIGPLTFADLIADSNWRVYSEGFNFYIKNFSEDLCVLFFFVPSISCKIEFSTKERQIHFTDLICHCSLESRKLVVRFMYVLAFSAREAQSKRRRTSWVHKAQFRFINQWLFACNLSATQRHKVPEGTFEAQ